MHATTPANDLRSLAQEEIKIPQVPENKGIPIDAEPQKKKPDLLEESSEVPEKRSDVIEESKPEVLDEVEELKGDQNFGLWSAIALVINKYEY